MSRNRKEPSLPTFLIIGAMKAGTTSLFDDLATSPGIAMSLHKEPNTLVRYESISNIKKDYGLMFKGCGDAKHRGEASTAYTKLPDHQGVPARARAVLGPELKLIYIRRDPIERILSQYRYEAPMGHCQGDTIDEAIRLDPRFINYSDYRMQEAAWLEHFDDQQLLRLDFEEYTRDRAGVVTQACAFLGAPPPPEEALAKAPSNASAGRRMQVGPAGRFARSYFYTRRLRPLMPNALRQTLKRLTPRAPDTFQTPSDETLDWLRKELLNRRIHT